MTMPPGLYLSVAVVMVRALGISRGVSRWLDRMITHDVALRGVVSLRTNLFIALARRGDDTLTRVRRGDLLSRLGDDAQELGDHVIKAIVPGRSEEHTSELQSRGHLVCRPLLETKQK